MRTPHSTPPHATPGTPYAMDVMRPSLAFGSPPAPSALDPRRWLGVVLRMVTRTAARVVRSRVATRGRVSVPVGGTDS